MISIWLIFPAHKICRSSMDSRSNWPEFINSHLVNIAILISVNGRWGNTKFFCNFFSTQSERLSPCL